MADKHAFEQMVKNNPSRCTMATTQSSSTSESPAPRTAPGPKGLPILGNLIDMQRGRHHFYHAAWKEYGEIVRLHVGPMTMHLLTHPDHIHHVLVRNKENYCKGLGYRKAKLLLGNGLFVSEGAHWKRQRRLMQPPFTAKSIPLFTDMMVDSTLKMLDDWTQLADRNESFEMNMEMVRITMSIIGRTMLGMDLAADGRKVSDALIEVLAFVGESSVAIVDVPLWVPTPMNLRFKKNLAVLDGVVEKIITHHREHPDEGEDNLLSMLIKARDPDTGEAMTAAELRDEIITIFLAGHETTALLLTWTWWLLSEHPEVEEKFHAELNTVLGGRTPTAADLPNLPYTKMIVEETMRLYPPVWMFPRDAVEDDVIDGYHIPKGSMLFLSPYISQRNPKYWDDPETFRPERFSDAEASQRVRNTYYPFGAGPRTCIGNHFAMLESQIVLATIGQQFRVRPVEGQQVEPASIATFRPKDGIHVRLEKRTQTAPA